MFMRNGSSITGDIFVSTRQTRAAQFGAASALAGPVNTSAFEADPYLAPAGDTLYFARSTAQPDLFAATAHSGVFDVISSLNELNTSANERSPVISADGQTIFWASNRTDLGAKGDYDIYTATRANNSATFDHVHNIAELNSSRYEAPNWISPDGCRLYFQQFDGNTYSIYVAHRSSP
jgi:hypothetical protein